MVAARTAATKFSRLEFDEIVVRPAHPAMRAELLTLSPSILVPRLKCIRGSARRALRAHLPWL